MVVRCPHCQSAYRLDAARVPAHAVRVRCPRCAQIFRVTANAASAPGVTAPPAPQAEPPPPDNLGIERDAWRPPIGQPASPAKAPAAPAPSAPQRPVWTAEGERTLDLGGQPAKGPAPRLETAPFRPGATPAEPPPGAPPVNSAPPAVRAEPPRSVAVPPPPAAPAPFQPAQAPVAAAPAPRAPTPPARPMTVPASHERPQPAPSAPVAAPPPEPARPAPPPSGPAHDRARRLARVLVSDILVYNEAVRDRARQEGTLAITLATEIRKAWDLYATKIGSEVATTTPYFKDALNEILAGGEAIF